MSMADLPSSSMISTQPISHQKIKTKVRLNDYRI
jgi:hypothetical protein